MIMTPRYSLKSVGTIIQDFFNKEAVEATARRTKFVQRFSPMGGQIFLQVSVFGFIDDPEANLDDLAQVCADLGVEITAQGFDQRINSRAIIFLQEMLSQAIEHFKSETPLPLPLLQQFSAINLVDSTVLSLPDNMVAEYPGSGGDGPVASLKVQLNFEFLHGNLEQIVFQPGQRPDQNFTAYLERVQPASLNINDLGYFRLDSLKTIDQDRDAYYLSRYLFGTGLSTPAGEPIELAQMLKNTLRQPFEQAVLLGSKEQLPCRLICIPLPQEVADRRRQKAQENARRKGRTLSQQYLTLLDWIIFVTNVPQPMLSIEQVALLYRVRWQIELLFKLWKSYAGLKHIQGRRRERLLYELYAKMIGIILPLFFLAPLRMPHGPWANRELSAVKVREIFQRFALELVCNLSLLSNLLAVLRKIHRRIERFGFKQKRKKQPNICHALALAFTIYSIAL
jgi:hypothetical protein